MMPISVKSNSYFDSTLTVLPQSYLVLSQSNLGADHDAKLIAIGFRIKIEIM